MVLQFGLLNTDTCRGLPLLPSEPREEFLYMLETILVVWMLLVMVLLVQLRYVIVSFLGMSYFTHSSLASVTTGEQLSLE
jgi:hypothetical protein